MLLELALTLRDLELDDLADLEWSGGPEHVRALAELWQVALQGDAVVLVVVLPGGRLLAVGSVDFRRYVDAGFVSNLSVHEMFRSFGIGSQLIAALEARTANQGRSAVRLHVEQDNPRAATLYRQRGYREIGSTLDRWAVAGGRTYVTVSVVLQRELPAPPQ